MVTSLGEALRILKNACAGRSDFGWPGGQLRGIDSGAGEATRGAGFADGPDERRTIPSADNVPNGMTFWMRR